MTKLAFDRDNVLSPEERIISARKCLNLLTPLTDGMSDSEAIEALKDELKDDIESVEDKVSSVETDIESIKDRLEKLEGEQ